MGAVLLAGGSSNKRSSLPNSKIMIHQPWVGGLQGQTTDIEIHAREMVKSRDKLYSILAYHTGKQLADIAKDCERDYYLTSDEAKEYKLIDTVLDSRKNKK
jgi:ATP-dependent Clp protease protease subunit